MTITQAIAAEPVRTTAGVTGIVNAVLLFLTQWPIVHWTGDQTGLVFGVWNAVVAAYLAFVVRGQVTPTGP